MRAPQLSTLLLTLALPLLASCGDDGAGALSYVTTVIDRDNNGDGILNPGEEACLKVEVANTGGEEVPRSSCELVSEQDDVSVNEGSARLSFNTCTAGESCWRIATPCVTIEPGARPRTLSFSCTLSPDDGSASYPLSFELPLEPTAAKPSYSGLTIDGDESEDGVLNPGESACLKIEVTNTGSSELSRTSGILTSVSPQVHIPESQAGLGFNSCDPEESCWRITTPCVEVARRTPPGTVLPFVVALVDQESNTFPLTFEVQVQATAGSLSYKTLTVDDDGNGDGVVQPGERACLRVEVQNVGSSLVTPTQGPLSSTSPYVEVSESSGTLRYNGCDPNESCWRVVTPCFTLSEEAPPGTELDFACELEDQQGNLFPIEFSLQAG